MAGSLGKYSASPHGGNTPRVRLVAMNTPAARISGGVGPERRALVLGAGVIGLTAALCLLEGGFEVRIAASSKPGDTTSANAGAIWGPFLSLVDSRLEQWSFQTYDEFARLAALGVNSVRMLVGTFAAGEGLTIPSWVSRVEGSRACAPGEIPRDYVSAFRLRAPVVDMPAYLDFLETQLLEAGVSLELLKASHVAELARPGEIIVNCTGLGARDLVGDAEMWPSRGFLVVAENPGLTEFFSERGDGPELLNILPQGNKVVLGGSVDHGISLEPDPVILEGIVARCATVRPELAASPVWGHRAGFRPCRTRVRLDWERTHGHGVIHSYGHAGSGVSVSWGVGRAVAKLAARLAIGQA